MISVGGNLYSLPDTTRRRAVKVHSTAAEVRNLNFSRKGHALVDTDGRALKLRVHAASVQDRAGPLLRASRPRWPFVEVAFADGCYQGPRVAASSPIPVEIVRKPEGQVGFAVIARPWVVERFFAWIDRNRRLAKDVERTIASPKAFLYAASAMLLMRRLAR